MVLQRHLSRQGWKKERKKERWECEGTWVARKLGTVSTSGTTERDAISQISGVDEQVCFDISYSFQGILPKIPKNFNFF